MKSKDVSYMVLAALILVVAGYLAFTKLAPKPGVSKDSQVEVVGTFPSEMDSAAKERITNNSLTQDYAADFDLKSGLQNPAPFGQ